MLTAAASTPETRSEARRALEAAYAILEQANQRWPEVRLIHALAVREREANNFGPSARRMFEA